MVNCVVADVRLILDTGLSDDELGHLIELADAEISARGITANKKLVSMLLASALASLRDDKSRAQGEYGGTPGGYTNWRKLAEEIIQKGESIPFIIHTDTEE